MFSFQCSVHCGLGVFVRSAALFGCGFCTGNSCQIREDAFGDVHAGRVGGQFFPVEGLLLVTASEKLRAGECVAIPNGSFLDRGNAEHQNLVDLAFLRHDFGNDLARERDAATAVTAFHVQGGAQASCCFLNGSQLLLCGR